MKIDMDAETAHALEVFVQFVLGPVLVLFVGWLLDRRNKKRVEAVAHSINNSHPDHLRDDLDSKFSTVFAQLRYVIRVQKKQAKVIVGMREDIGTLFENDAAQMSRDTDELQQITNVNPPKGRIDGKILFDEAFDTEDLGGLEDL